MFVSRFFIGFSSAYSTITVYIENWVWLQRGGLAGLELASICSCSMHPAVFCIFMGAWPPRFETWPPRFELDLLGLNLTSSVWLDLLGLKFELDLLSLTWYCTVYNLSIFLHYIYIVYIIMLILYIIYVSRPLIYSALLQPCKIQKVSFDWVIAAIQGYK